MLTGKNKFSDEFLQKKQNLEDEKLKEYEKILEEERKNLINTYQRRLENDLETL